MTSYFIRRLILVPVTFLAITFMVYAVLRIVPGGPIAKAEQRLRMSGMKEGGAGGGRAASASAGQLSPEGVQELKRFYHLDRSVPVGYLQWLGLWPREVRHLVPYAPPDRHSEAEKRLTAARRAFDATDRALTTDLAKKKLIVSGGRLWGAAPKGAVSAEVRKRAALFTERTFGDRTARTAYLAQHGLAEEDGAFFVPASPSSDPAWFAAALKLVAARTAAAAAVTKAEKETGYFLSDDGKLIQLALRPLIELKKRQKEVQARLGHLLEAAGIVSVGHELYEPLAKGETVPADLRKAVNNLGTDPGKLLPLLAARGFTWRTGKFFRRITKTRIAEDPDRIETIRQLFGLDDQVTSELARIQARKHFEIADSLRVYHLVRRFSGIFELDFGTSVTYYEPVLSVIASKIEVSVQFGLAGFLLSWIICVPLGVLKAIRHRSLFDNLSSAAVFFGYAIPGFVVCLILLATLAVNVSWIPLGGYKPPGIEHMSYFASVWGRIRYMFIPLVGYTIGGFATMTVLMKNSLMENLGQDYVRTAFAKGLSERRVIFVHALRNSLIPITAGIGNALAILFAGSFLIEKTCNIDGMGLLGYESIIQRDYPIILGLLVFGVLIQLFGNILSDIVWAVIDPRIRFE